MKTAIKVFATFVIALFALGAFGAAYAASDETQKYIAITDVNYDDPVAPGTTLNVEIELTNSHQIQDFEDVNVKAWLINSFGDRITDKVVAGTMQIQQDSEKTITLKINVPEDLEPGEYTLKVEADGIWEKGTQRETVTAENTVEVEQNDDALFVKTVKTAETDYKAGDTVDVAVTVVNNGVDDQDNVVVSIAVPEFDIQKSLKIFGTLFAGNSQTMYFTFDMPEDADGGIYTMTATAGNAIAKSSTSDNLIVKDTIEAGSANVKSSDVNLGDITVGKTKEMQITVSNKDSATKSYAITASGNDWAEITATPSKFDLRPGQTQTVTIGITAEETGKNTAEIYVFENGAAISSIDIEANAGTSMTIIGAAIVGLIIILALAVVYFQYYRNGNGSSKAKHIYY